MSNPHCPDCLLKMRIKRMNDDAIYGWAYVCPNCHFQIFTDPKRDSDA